MACQNNARAMEDSIDRAFLGAGAAVGGALGYKFTRTELDKIQKERTQRAVEKAWKNRCREAEQEKIDAAKKKGLFFDNLGNREVEEKFIVAGTVRASDGTVGTDKIEVYSSEKARSIAGAAGYSLWKVSTEKGKGGKIGYRIENMVSGESFTSPGEPYGRRPEANGSFELDRPEADKEHSVIDKRSNKVVI